MDLVKFHKKNLRDASHLVRLNKKAISKLVNVEDYDTRQAVVAMVSHAIALEISIGISMLLIERKRK